MINTTDCHVVVFTSFQEVDSEGQINGSERTDLSK